MKVTLFFLLYTSFHSDYTMIELSNALTDRKVQSMQFKIQQFIDITDQEIFRLQETLVTLKKRILDKQRIWAKINEKIEQKKYDIDRDYKINIINLNRIKINLISKHQQKIREITENNKNEVENLHKRFQNNFSMISNDRNEFIMTEDFILKNQNIDDEIDVAKCLLEHLKNNLAVAKEKQLINQQVICDIDIKFTTQSIIFELKERLRQKNEERVNFLNSSKMKMNECFSLLDQIVKDSEQKVKEKRIELQKLDEWFQRERVKLTYQKDEGIIINGKRLNKAKGSEERSNHPSHSFNADICSAIIFNNSKSDNKEAKKRKNTKRQTINSQKKGEIALNITELRSKIFALKKKLKKKDKRLEKVREENSMLKSKIAKKRYDIRFGL